MVFDSNDRCLLSYGDAHYHGSDFELDALAREIGIDYKLGATLWPTSNYMAYAFPTTPGKWKLIFATKRSPTISSA